jgi:hypothetical protein
MKAISIRQPYAFAIVHGFKPVENRDWRHPYRGPVLIHAGQKEETDQVTRIIALIADQTGTPFGKLHALYKKHSARGAIVGRATVADCVTAHASRWFNGPFAFVLTDPEFCEPQRFRGALSFFEVPDFVARTLHFQRLADAAAGDLFS